MCTIRTVIETAIVHTIPYENKWVTIITASDEHGCLFISSTDSFSVKQAGVNHLEQCVKVRENYVRRRISEGLSDRGRCKDELGTNPETIASSDAGID